MRLRGGLGFCREDMVAGGRGEVGWEGRGWLVSKRVLRGVVLKVEKMW